MEDIEISGKAGIGSGPLYGEVSFITGDETTVGVKVVLFEQSKRLTLLNQGFLPTRKPCLGRGLHASRTEACGTSSGAQPTILPKLASTDSAPGGRCELAWPDLRFGQVQKLFNVLSVASFLMSSVMFGGTLLLYSRVPGMITRYVEGITDDLTDTVTEIVPGKIEEMMPELPKKTGLPIPFE